MAAVLAVLCCYLGVVSSLAPPRPSLHDSSVGVYERALEPPLNASTPDGGPTLISSVDGTCGNGITCLNSTIGRCCSAHGYCGNADIYCGDGCNPVFGSCNGPGLAAVSSSSGSINSVSSSSSSPVLLSETTTTRSKTVWETNTVTTTKTAVATSITYATTLSTSLTVATSLTVITSISTSVAISVSTATVTAYATETATETATATATSTSIATLISTSTRLHTSFTTVTSFAYSVSTSTSTQVVLSSQPTPDSSADSSAIPETTWHRPRPSRRPTRPPFRPTTTADDGDGDEPTPASSAAPTLWFPPAPTYPPAPPPPQYPPTPQYPPAPQPTHVSPILTGTTTKCKRYYEIRRGDTCDSVAVKEDISLLNLLDWNTALSHTGLVDGLLCTVNGILPLLGGSNCKTQCDKLPAGYYICVGT